MLVKEFILKLLSLGSHDELSEGKKFALQVAVLDGYGSVGAFLFYSILTFQRNQFPFFYYHFFNLLLMLVGLFLIHRKYYDLARPLIHLGGLVGIYICNDVYGLQSGFEYYYFISIMMPHITFALDELWKGIPLSLIACSCLIFQQVFGTGLILGPLPFDPQDRVTAIAIVIVFTTGVLIVARWRLFHALREIQRQQRELVHSSKILALGEMSASIAHEVNNPLQALSLQVEVLKKMMTTQSHPSRIDNQFIVIDNNVQRMTKMMSGLKEIAREGGEGQKETFPLSKVLDDVINVSSVKLRSLGVTSEVTGNVSLKIFGCPVQLSQIFLNLLNNSIDAIKDLSDKWVRITVEKKGGKVIISVIDSGRGISEEIASKMMTPFFSTKSSSKGNGLGLSISKQLVQKNNGQFYYDPFHPNTRFVLEFPISH